MSKANILKQYQQAFAKWPAEVLRPDVPFPKMIQKAVEQRLETTTSSFDLAREQAQVNAIHTLLQDRYKKKYPLSSRILEPRSKPQYYKDLLRELEEAPKRSWLARQLNKWKGVVRWK